MIRHLCVRGAHRDRVRRRGAPVYTDPQLGSRALTPWSTRTRAAILGREIGAQVLLILRTSAAVCPASRTPQQTPLRRLSLAEADQLLAGSELGTGSMRPKVEAAAASFAAVEASARSSPSCRRDSPPRGRDRNDDHAGARVNLHEYQAREILRRHGIPIPEAAVAATRMRPARSPPAWEARSW